MLTAEQVAEMRAVADEALPSRCDIQRRTRVSDNGGGYTDQWFNQASSVPCRVAPAGGGESAATASRVVDETTHFVTLPAETDVTEADQIVTEDATYEVTAVRRRGPWEVSRRVEVREAP